MIAIRAMAGMIVPKARSGAPISEEHQAAGEAAAHLDEAHHRRGGAGDMREGEEARRSPRGVRKASRKRERRPGP